MWSVDDLDRNISTQYYERRLAAQRESSTLPVPYTGQADPLEYIKNPMVAEFMGFHRDTNYSESELEQALIDERPAAELDNALMVEMRVGCKVQSLFLKSIIHGLRFLCASLRGKLYIKNAGKLGKDFPAAFIYHFSGISALSYPRWSVKYSSENII